MLNAKNGLVEVGNTDLNYISFGKGGKPLVILPGLGEALKNVKGMALPFAWMYRAFAKNHTVYVFSRKNQIPRGYSIQAMAEDQAQAMHTLGITDACVMGVSQGGMIAMHLAAAHQELAARLVLANTAAKCNSTMERVVREWLRLVKTDDYKGLLVDMGEKVYTKRKLKIYKPWYPILAIVGKPKSFERFMIQANACLGQDASGELKNIQCPTLVIGGDSDQIVGAESALELAKHITNCQLMICEGYGHSAYEEDPNFNSRVLDFFDKEWSGNVSI